jgi:hypothetical protein
MRVLTAQERRAEAGLAGDAPRSVRAALTSSRGAADAEGEFPADSDDDAPAAAPAAPAGSTAPAAPSGYWAAVFGAPGPLGAEPAALAALVSEAEVRARHCAPITSFIPTDSRISCEP